MADHFHIPVLKNEIIQLLKEITPSQGGGAKILDGTFGGGGHTLEILRQIPSSQVIALDQDLTAVQRGKALIEKEGLSSRVQFFHTNFLAIPEVLKHLSLPEESLDAILLDLGVSSHQLDTPERGFSFRSNGPLDMRMNPNDPTIPNAADLINKLPESDIAKIIKNYGEERYAKRIARFLIEERVHSPIETTEHLTQVIHRACPPQKKQRRQSSIDPATRTFQALRIAVNEELSILDVALRNGTIALKEKGRFLVISFHSLEDRIVKNYFRDLSKPEMDYEHNPYGECKREAIYRLVTKKPITPTSEEVLQNSRSRSSKLRCAEKIVSWNISSQSQFEPSSSSL